MAERVGVTTRTIRYYEELGLLGPGAARSKGAHRLYTESDVDRLAELIRLRDLLGLSLEELTALAETGQARAALRDQWAETTSDGERVAIIKAAIPILERQLGARRAPAGRSSTSSPAEIVEKLESLRANLLELDADKPSGRLDAGGRSRGRRAGSLRRMDTDQARALLQAERERIEHALHGPIEPSQTDELSNADSADLGSDVLTSRAGRGPLRRSPRRAPGGRACRSPPRGGHLRPFDRERRADPGRAPRGPARGRTNGRGAGPLRRRS